MKPEDLRGLEYWQIPTRLKLTPRTWDRWMHEGIPQRRIEAARLAAGDLSILGWDDWRLVNGQIFAPGWLDGWQPGQISGAWYLGQQLRHCRMNCTKPYQYELDIKSVP